MANSTGYHAKGVGFVQQGIEGDLLHAKRDLEIEEASDEPCKGTIEYLNGKIAALQIALDAVTAISTP